MTHNLINFPNITVVTPFPNITVVVPNDTFCPKCGTLLDCNGTNGVLIYWCEECLSLCPKCGTYPLLYLNNHHNNYDDPIPSCEACDYLFINPIDEIKDPGYN